MIRAVKATPVDYLTCPKCEFPLNIYFCNADPQQGIVIVHIACARCCWTENWGELKIQPEGAAHAGT